MLGTVFCRELFQWARLEESLPSWSCGQVLFQQLRKCTIYTCSCGYVPRFTVGSGPDQQDMTCGLNEAVKCPNIFLPRIPPRMPCTFLGIWTPRNVDRLSLLPVRQHFAWLDWFQQSCGGLLRKPAGAPQSFCSVFSNVQKATQQHTGAIQSVCARWDERWVLWEVPRDRSGSRAGG